MCHMTRIICIYIYTHTDNCMWGKVKIYGIRNAPDYSDEGEHWRITYNKSEGTYEVYNCNWGGAGVWLKGQLPTRVEMRAYTTWSVCYQWIAIAVTGGNVRTFNHSEQPYPGDDGNPEPFVMVLKPGENE